MYSHSIASIAFQTLALFSASAVIVVAAAGVDAGVNVVNVSSSSSSYSTGQLKQSISTFLSRDTTSTLRGTEEICSDILLEQDYLSNKAQIEYSQILLSQIANGVIDYSEMETYMTEVEEHCTTNLGGDFFSLSIEEDENCSPFGDTDLVSTSTSTYLTIKNSPICLTACESADAAMAAIITREGDGCSGKIIIDTPSLAPSMGTPSPTTNNNGEETSPDGAADPNSGNAIQKGRFPSTLITMTVMSMTLM